MDNRFEKFTSYMIMFNRYIQKIKELEMKNFNLHANHTMCIYYLAKCENLTLTELSKLCKEDKAQTSRTINELIKLGYVKKDNIKNYKANLYLTTEGKALASMMERKIEKALEVGGNNLSEEKRNEFYDTLNIIMENLENYYKLENK